MTAAQIHRSGGTPPEEQLRARLVEARVEALAEYGISLAEAHAIADCVTVDIVEAVELLGRGCPAALVVPILG